MAATKRKARGKRTAKKSTRRPARRTARRTAKRVAKRTTKRSVRSTARRTAKRVVRRAAGKRRARKNPWRSKRTGRVLKVERVRGVRSAKAVMRKAAKAKRRGKPITFDVTKAGVRRSVKAAAVRLQHRTANVRRRGPAAERAPRAVGGGRGGATGALNLNWLVQPKG